MRAIFLPRLVSSPSAARLAVAALCAVALIFAGCGLLPKRKSKPISSKGPLRTVQHVDLARFMGDWRIIANIPYSGEKGRVDSITSYALRPDGKIENWFTYRKKSFSSPQITVKAEAEVVNAETNAEWKFGSFGPTKEIYHIIELDSDYQWAVLGHTSRKYGWILARQRAIPHLTYEAILDRVAAHGYDPGSFAKVPQFAEQPSAE
ncbi:MAG TPA: lipocalin family protein [Chthoniobacteraceae bacterium]|jgi:apolipoprotein D and lipocalin family protein